MSEAKRCQELSTRDPVIRVPGKRFLLFSALHLFSAATEADFSGQTPSPPDSLLEWADWCHYLFRASPQQVTRRGDGQGLRLDYAALVASDSPNVIRFADLTLCPTAPVAAHPMLDEVRLHCEHGQARLLGTTSIEWTDDGNSQSEELATERTETEVLLDHFCRRVVGGLIPVPTLEDLARARLSVGDRASCG